MGRADGNGAGVSAGAHAYQASDAEFDQFTAHFVPPHVDEGRVIIRHEAS
jgi:folate-dependent phosphoribosylglycinamide formyltransferase PurN